MYTRHLFFLCCFFFLGVLRVLYTFWSLGLYVEKPYVFKNVFQGYVVSEPDVRHSGVRYILKPLEKKRKGHVYVSYDQYPLFNYGDVVDVHCHSLERPQPFDRFRYDMYLARFGVSHICKQPSLKKVGSGYGNPVLRYIFSIKNTIAGRINVLWHEPYAGFVAGLLYGYRGGLGSLNELFAKTGVTHIIAISGYNITIIATLLIGFCGQFAISRRKTFYVIVLGIFFFVLFAGASASVVRAGIMGVLVLFARERGRRSVMHNILLCTVFIMVLHNPLVLLWDAGFQLSFLATLGLVYLVPLVEKKMKKIPSFFGFKEVFVSTFAATLVTAPMILFQFGRFSTVAILVNILILWIIPHIMVLGFFAVVFSFIFEPLAQIFSWCTWFGMFYVVSVVRFFADMPFASVDMRMPLVFPVVCYLFGFFYYKKLYEKV